MNNFLIRQAQTQESKASLWTPGFGKASLWTPGFEQSFALDSWVCEALDSWAWNHHPLTPLTPFLT